MKTLAIMQPYLLPYIGYFQLINSADHFVIYDDVNYIKRGWVNRNNILVNGKKHLITLPVSQASSYSKINSINILDETNKFIATIENAYRRAPYYAEVMESLGGVLGSDERRLSVYLGQIIKVICEYLDIKTEITYSSDLEKDSSLSSQEKIIDICERLSASRYINAAGGRALYNKIAFQTHGIDLKFIESDLKPYKQYSDTPVIGLSILDVLMFNSRAQVVSMLNDYKLT